MVEKLHRVERGKSEGLNKYDLFFNRKAARVLLLMFRPMTIKKISRKSYGIHLSYLEHKEPKKLLLKIWREKKGGKGEEYKYKMEREILERILKNQT
jgi:hypothetical protein